MADDSTIIKINDDEDAEKVFDDFIRTKNIRYFNAFYEYISSKKFSTVNINIKDIKDLFYKIDNKSLFEYLIDNTDKFGFKFKQLILSDIVTIKELIKLGRYELLDFMDEKMLLLEFENGKTVFEYLLENDLLSPKIINNIWENIWADNNYIERIKEKDISLLKYLKGYILVENKIGGISILEFLFQNNLVDKEVIGKIQSEVVFDLCIKYKRKDLFPYLTESVLKSKRNDKTILEFLLNNNIYPNKVPYSDSSVIKILYDYRLFDYFINYDEDRLLTKVSKDKTLLDALLENNKTPTTKYYTSKKALVIILKYKRFDLIKYFALDTLISLCNLNETYLDLILQEKKSGLDFNLSTINNYSSNVKSVAKYYIIVARNGFINHIDDISEYSLTKNNGELLKELISIDKDLTLNVIIPRKIKEKVNVAILLRMIGIEQKNIKVNLHSMNIVNDYLKEFNSEFKDAIVSEEEQNLLNQFKDLMLSDGESDKELINAVIASYTYLISSGNEYGLRELKKIIEIKEKRKDFIIVRTNDGSCFRKIDNSVNLENTVLNTINHEMGHALFYNLTNCEIPKEYEQLLYEVRTNSEVLKKIREYSIKYQEIKNIVCGYVDEKYMSTYQISEEELKELDEFLNTDKEKIKKALINKGYKEEVIDSILSGIYSKEEYINQERRIKREELIDAIIRSEYGAFLSIGDILDSIFEGKFRSGELLDSDNNKILPTSGHGVAYYSRGVDWAFNETIANYSAIVKSVDGKEMLRYLREIVGERFINCIESYYRNNISLSNKDLSEKEAKSL